MKIEDLKKKIEINYITSFENGGVRKIKIKGNRGLGLCPFHNDNSPSFSFDTSRGLWKCFAGCGQGNIYHFYGKVYNIDPKHDFVFLLKEIAYWEGFK